MVDHMQVTALMSTSKEASRGITLGIRLKTIGGPIAHPQSHPRNIPGSSAPMLWS